MKMRLLKLTASAMLITISSRAQLKLPASSPAFKNDLQKVIDDFNNGFASIKGDVQAENPQTVEYVSQVKLSGAEECIITQYSGAKPIYSFQAVMLTTEDFEEASKKYKALYNQLKGMTIKINRDYTYNLSGDYDAPDESKKFSSTVMRLLPSATQLPKLKVEVSMQYYFPEWKVSLLVYEREREDKERGKREDDEADK
jgi:hypothetical protein